MATIPGQLLEQIDQARELYHQLVLLVAGAGYGKTSALLAVAASTSAPLVNVNLELSHSFSDFLSFVCLAGGQAICCHRVRPGWRNW